MGGKILVAKETFSTDIDGVPTTFHKDVTRVREGHPILKELGDRFKELDVHYDVEQTSRAGTRRADKAAEKAKAADKGDEKGEDGAKAK